jgi:hypothetical protein
MEFVDYQKLAEQYASFLVAIGGVSITVLALVLTLTPKSGESPELTEPGPRTFLVIALIVATLSCFVGAQMMAETAAFTNYTEPVKCDADNKPVGCINYTKPVPPAIYPETVTFTRPPKKADRLFLLASSNIFVAIILVFFALMLIPRLSHTVHLQSLKPIPYLFFLIVAGALYWAIFAGQYRMIVDGRGRAIILALVISLIWGFSLYKLRIPKRWQLWATFAPSALLTVFSLAWFTWLYTDGDQKSLLEATIYEVWFFSISIGLSYAALVATGIKIVLGKQFTDASSADEQSIGEQIVGNDLLDQPEHEQKESNEQQVTAKSKRRYIVPLLFASIFIASTTALVIIYKNFTSGDASRVRLSSDTAIWVAVFNAIVAAIGTVSTIIFARRRARREERETESDDAESDDESDEDKTKKGKP